MEPALGYRMDVVWMRRCRCKVGKTLILAVVRFNRAKRGIKGIPVAQSRGVGVTQSCSCPLGSIPEAALSSEDAANAMRWVT